MDYNEAISLFVKTHFKDLTKMQTDKEIVKKLKQRFYEQFHIAASSRFSTKDLAERIAETVARSKKNLSLDSLTDTIGSILFIREELGISRIREIIESVQTKETSVLTPEDLKKLREEEYLNKVEDQFRSKAEKEAEKKLEQTKKELESLRKDLEREKSLYGTANSELDKIPPSVDIETLISKSDEISESRQTVWWKDAGLDGDPFGSNQGLIGIPETKYDDIVVITPFIDSFLRNIKEHPLEMLGKNVIVLGEFGSGKTTLFEIIAHKSGKSGILPIFTLVNPDQSVIKLTNQLISQVADEIKKVSPYSQINQDSMYVTKDEIGMAVEVMKMASKSMNLKGFLILVDGLHKSLTYQKQSLEFLEQLQNFQERLARSRIPCGIIVAGSLLWEIEINQNPSLSGSFYNIEKVPVLTEDNAVEAVVRRINAFVPVGGPKPTIVRDRLREAFRVLSSRLPRSPTFRDYLDHVRNRLVSLQFSDVGISIALHMETIELVREEIKKTKLYDGYNRLISPGLHSSSFRNAIKAIVTAIYDDKEISESEEIFKANTGAFYVLRNEGFIEKRFHPSNKVVSWCLSTGVIEALQDLNKRYGTLPRDALEALFAENLKIMPHETSTIYGDVRKKMEEMVASFRSSSWPELPNLIQSSIEEIDKIEEKMEFSQQKNTVSEISESFSLSLRNMMKAIMYVSGDGNAIVNFNTENFLKSWYAPDESEDMISYIKRTKPTPQNSSELFGLFHLHSQYLSSLSILLLDLVRGEGIMRLNGRLLTSEESFSLHTARMLFSNYRYPESVDVASEVLDRKIKDFVYPFLRMAWGNKAISRLSSDLRDKINSPPKGHPMAKRPQDDNFFYHISRSEYSKVIFQKEIEKIVFEESITNQELEGVKSSFELLFSLEDREAHKDRPAFFRSHSTDIGRALNLAPRICELLNRTADRILSDNRFSIMKKDEYHLEYCFRTGDVNFVNHSMDASSVEHFTYLLLSNMENATVSIPPIERICDIYQSQPETIYGILRGCESQELLEVTKESNSFRLNATITQNGKERLESLRKRYENK